MRKINLDVGHISTQSALKVHSRLNRLAARLPERLQPAAKRVADGFAGQVGQVAGYIEMTGLRWPVNHYEQKLSDVVSRGSRLRPEDYPRMKQEGYRGLVDLCREGSHDQTHGVEHGFNTLNVRITDNGAPKTHQIKAFLDFVTHPDNQPAYFHCEAGVGRTGIMASCYRMAVQGWSLHDAIAESMERGMRLPKQLEAVRQFAADLAEGKVEGYPLAQPVPNAGSAVSLADDMIDWKPAAA